MYCNTKLILLWQPQLPFNSVNFNSQQCKLRARPLCFVSGNGDAQSGIFLTVPDPVCIETSRGSDQYEIQVMIEVNDPTTLQVPVESVRDRIKDFQSQAKTKWQHQIHMSI